MEIKMRALNGNRPSTNIWRKTPGTKAIVLKQSKNRNVMNLDFFLSPTDSARAQNTLTKLRRHLPPAFVVTGGLAIGAHLARRGASPILRPLNDIDFLVDSF